MKGLTFKEKILLLIIGSVSFVILYHYYTIKFFSSGGDSAGFVDVMKNIAEGHGMVSSAFSAIYSLLPYLTFTQEQYVNADYKSLHYMQDFSEWHPYLIAYLLAFFQKIGFTSLQVASGSMSFIIVGSLTIITLFLRNYNVPRYLAYGFVIIIFSYPIFSGNIFGQFYFDRLFVFHGLLLLLLMHMWSEDRKSVPKYVIFLAFLLSSLISERTAIMSAFIIIAFFIFNWKQLSFKQDYKISLLPALALIYVFVYALAFQNSPYYSSINIDSIMTNLSNSFDFTNSYGQKSLFMYLMLAPFIILSMMNIKYFLMTLMSILPNLIITIGGAEKSGFTTHYHDMYLPFLLFSATIGILKISTFKNRTQKIVLGLLAASVFLLNFMKYDDNHIYIDFKDLTPVNLYSQLLPRTLPHDSLHANKDMYMTIVSSIPHNAKVSSLEWTMPALVQHGVSRIDYLPIGLNENDYLIVEYPGIDNDMSPSIVSYLSDLNEQKKIASFLQKRITEKYEIDKKYTFYGKNYVVYKAKNNLIGKE